MAYSVRRIKLNHNPLHDQLALESGSLYSKTLTFFWRTVRRKKLWLKPKHLMKLFNSHNLHAHTADATVQAFTNAIKSWGQVRKTVPTARPPHKQKKFYSVTWKNSAIRIRKGNLILSNGKLTEPLIFKDWQHKLPVLCTLRWYGTGYELICCYKESISKQNITKEVPVAIDLGQIHVAVTSEGTILNGRLLRSIRQGRARSDAIIKSRSSGKKKGSRRYRKLQQARLKLGNKVSNKTKDILHKYTSGLTLYLKKKGYNTLVVGDLTGYRIENNKGKVRNQENHSWLYSQITWYLKYKWERLGLKFVTQEESYTSRICPQCGFQKKSSPKGRNYKCKPCGFKGHRDWVGSVNILNKYLGTFGKPLVDAVMAPATQGVRYKPNMSVAHGFCL